MRHLSLRGVLVAVALPFAIVLSPSPLLAQATTRPAFVVEGFVSRARLDPAVGGSRTEVQGIGGRVLAALAPLPGEQAGGLAQRLAVGAFANWAPHDDGRFAVAQYGAVADLHLLGAPMAGRLDPLLSLGAGAFRTRSEAGGARDFTLDCVRAVDFAPDPLPATCAAGDPSRRRVTNDFALSPAAALRIWMVPGMAVRLEARDVVVYRGAPRHNLELATGVSFVR